MPRPEQKPRARVVELNSELNNFVKKSKFRIFGKKKSIEFLIIKIAELEAKIDELSKK